MKRIEFRLSMPSVASWNGKWTGEGKNYVIYKNFSNKRCEELGIGENGKTWYHRWDDGWTACVSARIMKTGERKTKSDGFCGYDWMINNIIIYDSTEKP